MLGDTIKGTLTVVGYGLVLSITDFKTANSGKEQEGAERAAAAELTGFVV
jgi:hypothetical protein